jgi:hypothetical protein
MLTDDPKAQLSKASEDGGATVLQILRPLVHFMIENHLTYPLVITILKALFVEVAEKNFSLPQKKQTDSRINMLTGVHRKDVKRLRQKGELVNILDKSFLGIQLISHWLNDARFLDAEGKPRPLPLRTIENATEASFADLVEEVVRQDIRPRVVLDELQRLNLISVDENRMVTLNVANISRDNSLQEKLSRLGNNLQDHINAALHNIKSPQPVFVDNNFFIDNLSHAALQELSTLCTQISAEALERVQARAKELANPDYVAPEQSGTSGENPRFRMNFGIYNFADFSLPAVVPAQPQQPAMDQAANDPTA